MIGQTLRLYRNAYQGLAPSVWLLAGVMLINRCGTMVLPFLTLYLTQHLHYSVTDAGVVMAVYGAGVFVGTFLGGRLTDRFGFYYVQLLSLTISGLFLLLLQFVTHFYALCGSVFLFTLLGDAFRPANQSALAHYAGADTRTRAFSLNRLAINLGWAIGGGLGGWLAGINYSLLFWADGLTCLAAGAVLWAFLPVPAAADTPGSRTVETGPFVSAITVRLPHRDTLFVGFVGLTALYLTGFMQLFSLVPLYLKEVLRMTERTIGSLMALNGLLIVAVEMALVYRLEERAYRKPTLIGWGALLTAASYSVLGVVNAPIWVLLFILPVTLGEMLTIPFIQSFTVERSSPQTRGRYLALYAMGGALAQTTAPAFGSQMVARFGFSTHWWVIASLCTGAAVGFWWLGRRLGRTVPT